MNKSVDDIKREVNRIKLLLASISIDVEQLSLSVDMLNKDINNTYNNIE